PKPVPVSTLAGEFTLVNQSGNQQELPASVAVSPTTLFGKGGFDIIVGNPPFVTARNPMKRELWRARWKRVCSGKYSLVCPFFDLSFGLLTSDGQLGFIVSNAFAKREFGKPLVEDFFPTIDVQKVIDCSGLMFPGHGTPTCIVFGRNEKPDPKSSIRVSAILPGGGDLRTPPEESPLWKTLAERHDQPGFADSRVVVADRPRSQMVKWPWNLDIIAEPTKNLINANGSRGLRNVLAADVGFMFVIGRNDIFMMTPDTPRRLGISATLFKSLNVGDEIRDYELRGTNVVLFPYDQESLEVIKFSPKSPEAKYFGLFEEELSYRPTFSGTFAEEGRVPYEYHQLPVDRARNPRSIALAQIATHGHFVLDESGAAFNEKAPLLKLPLPTTLADHHLIAAMLNSSAALFWLKQVCFSKRESEEGATDTYFEFAGGKVQQLPVPNVLVAALRGQRHPLAERLTELSRDCLESGRQLATLSMKKLFEKPGEAYYEWNAALPGSVAPYVEIAKPFETADDLREAFARTVTLRETRRAEMIARQEEMDWLVYEAYGLIADREPPIVDAELSLAREQRPFCLWLQAEGDFDKAVSLIPRDWSSDRRSLWQARLAAIRENEHIRRIEQPVYKRRWDEQWKVGGSWACGDVAYAAEFRDAFHWWLAEKAEWYLEKETRSGPISIERWTNALLADARVREALEVYREMSVNGPQDDRPFAKVFKEIVDGETVPEGIPFAVPWEDLEKKNIKVPAKVKALRGKLNVPRERFRVRGKDEYLWAGLEWKDGTA
ncbi:MAG TPA: hypothetical protein VJ124_00735, partial [Pyrinomonadaceae bacterium]|nr:hypothetical protein [Pyrinomonadaceae bacterium]